MEFYWSKIISYIKDIGLLVGIVVGIFALMIHWKTIFKPHEKMLEDRKFAALEKALIGLRQNEFIYFYFAQDNKITFSIFQSLLKSLSESWANPFLPEHIQRNINEFVQVIYSNINILHMLLISTGKADESSKLDIGNIEVIFNKHKETHDLLAKELHLENTAFIFTLPKKD